MFKIKIEIKSDKAPKPVGPYSQAIRYKDLVFVSGQIPIDPLTNQLIKEPFSKAVETVMINIGEILKSIGASYDNIVKVTVYLTDLSRFQEFNEIYKRYFKEPYPARTVIEVKSLPRDAPIEIEVIAYTP
ncbi:MAG: Rid family detoxifying hydrolase [Sulfolobales archaeon]